MPTFPSKSLVFMLCLCGCAHDPAPQVAQPTATTQVTRAANMPILAQAKPEAATDYRLPGPTAVTVTKGQMEQDAGGSIDYTIYQPGQSRCDALVVLGHGFLRDQHRMSGIARQAASWGVPVATPDFSRSRPWAGHHDKNAADMVALARHLGARRVVYAGFSAGGLSALLAASSDPAATGFLGLDMVDDGTGAKAAATLRFPAHGLVATPSACNASGNGLATYAAAPAAKVLLVAGATHCHFEFPMDNLCGLVCGKGERDFSRAEIQETIRAMATASLAWQTGADPGARSWWEKDGAMRKSLAESGRVVDVLLPRDGAGREGEP